ncbi:AAA family ATPase [Chitinophaga agrisoli]|uniref:AAA family ATPase n=1 Tax=Chitinophaga agrisoli TaxID=2607653 RepID=A0A5B2VL53_9BACT|nr:ATP-binding protein [Chitinophaga agrisoli]KAA2239821.1 AAA family ATPase [Chitinophaga agrisoli]
MEHISIKNFAGIKAMDFEFKAINILTGPQGSGKSVTAKLLYFFKSIFPDIRANIETQASKQELDNKQKEKFLEFFPKDSWPKGDFQVTYTINDIRIVVEKLNGRIRFDYSENLKKALAKVKKTYAEEKRKLSNSEEDDTYLAELELKDKVAQYLSDEAPGVYTYNQYFVPAGRSVLANIPTNVYAILNGNGSLDPFLVAFGKNYENYKYFYSEAPFEKTADKKFGRIISEILGGVTYKREKDKDILIHDDNYKVNLSNASSAQQQALPLIVAVNMLNSVPFLPNAVVYIEDPEAYLSPVAQKAIAQLLARTFNYKSEDNLQIIITTQSPYILSAFNNLLEAGRLTGSKPAQAKDIAKIVPKDEQLSPGLLTAYSLNNGKSQMLIEKASGLITQKQSDSAADDIATEFGKLSDI